jgi:hypothetical protein
MLPSALPGRGHSSCSPQSAILVSLANTRTEAQLQRERENPKSVFSFQV